MHPLRQPAKLAWYAFLIGGSPPYRHLLFSGTGGGGLELVEISGPIVKVRITGPAASVMTVRVAVTQKLREKFPAIAAVQLVN